MSRALTIALRDKTFEQIERTQHLWNHLAPQSWDWSPPIAQPWTTGQLLSHLVACLAGFCAALHAAAPQRLSSMLALRSLPRAEGPEAVRQRFSLFASHVDTGFRAIDDAALAQVIPTVFVPAGESLATLLLGNLEHLINHKQQLFLYLRLQGIQVNSEDLYRFRGQ